MDKNGEWAAVRSSWSQWTTPPFVLPLHFFKAGFNFPVCIRAVMCTGEFLSLPPLPVSPVLTASAWRKHPALAALWDRLAHTWARFQANGAPPPPFGLFFAQLGQRAQAQHPHPPSSSLLPPRACGGERDQHCWQAPAWGTAFSLRTDLAFPYCLVSFMRRKKKAKLNRLQPVLSCHTVRRCQHCPRRRQQPGHGEGHRQGPPRGR